MKDMIQWNGSFFERFHKMHIDQIIDLKLKLILMIHQKVIDIFLLCRNSMDKILKI